MFMELAVLLKSFGSRVKIGSNLVNFCVYDRVLETDTSSDEILQSASGFILLCP